MVYDMFKLIKIISHSGTLPHNIELSNEQLVSIIARSRTHKRCEQFAFEFLQFLLD